ncbi:hypothetical protein ACFORO_42500 [Amycolatopsis halotolerans]|uniref:P22 coat protein-protein 5 domain protein n=1 Tax=Amycolatopsis halotolerans TaxID=330083 RepID=A0ABV7QXC7_9PSEU
MAIKNFIPEIWNAQMLENFHESVIAAGLVNRQYEGNATSGNTVHITGVVDVKVKDYKANGRTTSADEVADTRVDLLIDQEKNFDFFVDDIDKAQAAGSMDAYTRSASVGMAEDADKFILATGATGAGHVLPTPTTAVSTGDGAFNVIRDLRKTFNKAHIPQTQRVLLINAEFEALLEDASSKLMAANTAGDTQTLRSAHIGRLLNFDIYSTENLPNTDKAQALAFYQPAIAYVSQIEKTEGLRAQNKFADRLRGLHVYGGKVILPEAVAVWTNA